MKSLFGEHGKSRPPRPRSSLAQAHLGILIRHLPVTCWTTDERLRITSHRGPALLRSKTPRRLTGYTISNYFLCGRDDQVPIKQHLDALLGMSSQFELCRHDRIFDVAIEPLRNAESAIIGCISMALDVTEQRASAEQVRYQATTTV